jgi:phosphoribosylamine--glycine ligase
MMSDIVPALQASVDGTLEDFAVRWYPESALTVIMASRGYPGSTKPGSIIRNLPREERDDAIVFHCGTRRNALGEIEAHGGRVLAATALGKSVREAQQKAYQLVDTIDWPEGFCRRDIGWRAVEREKQTP